LIVSVSADIKKAMPLISSEPVLAYSVTPACVLLGGYKWDIDKKRP